jgi:hypothetical protein
MEKTDKKECPKCKSSNVIDIGARIGDISRIEPGQPIPNADYPIGE